VRDDRRELGGVRHYAPGFDRAACSAIVQSVPHAVLLLDARGHVVLANRAASLLFGRTMARLRGAPVAQLLSPDAISVLLRDFEARRVRVVETCLTKARTASVCTIKVTAAPLANGKPTPYTLLVIEDISDKSTLEQQLVDSEKQAAMGQLAAGLLHEVSNPLTSLGSNLLFVRNALPASASAAVTQALDASLDQLEQMRQLLGTLSSFPGRAAPRYQLADLHQVIRECLTFITRDSERRRIWLEVSLSPAVVICEIDVRLMKQVLLNLLKNAMEAMNDGGRLAVRTSQVACEGEPGCVVIEIADSGVGIAESDLRRVFRPLFSTKCRGAGLGLSFCRQTVEEHGGTIVINSTGKDQGTTVCMSLPVRQPRKQDD
jgi:PAS domain S-box-containing protein